MRQYSDSADAIKAYMEEVNFDFSKAHLTELDESNESRGGLRIVIDNYYKKPMSITVHHTWLDTFNITFDSPMHNATDTVEDVYAPDLIGLFRGLQLAMTGVTHDEWSKEIDKW